jgi:hypothetical protein
MQHLSAAQEQVATASILHTKCMHPITLEERMLLQLVALGLHLKPTRIASNTRHKHQAAQILGAAETKSI